MRTCDGVASLRAVVAEFRNRGGAVALVPTMGNLHAGHLSLVRQARELAQHVVVSIFVNPTQFAPGEDLDNYPRTLAADTAALQQAGVDLLWTPGGSDLYPLGLVETLTIQVPGLEKILCGASRPGHFRGVATVVGKLLLAAQPDFAVFGEKDYQQLLVIRRLVTELLIPVEIVSGATVREADGLAMSSRNSYLTAAERPKARALSAVLQQVVEAARSGHADFARLSADATRRLADAGLEPEYVAVRRAEDLALPGASDYRLRVLAAARLGAARLIDNLPLELARD